jgi:hypothetical protein
MCCGVHVLEERWGEGKSKGVIWKVFYYIYFFQFKSSSELIFLLVLFFILKKKIKKLRDFFDFWKKLENPLKKTYSHLVCYCDEINRLDVMFFIFN